MGPFIHNLNPDIVRFGPFAIRFYGIVYAIGFLLVSYYLASRSSRIKNLSKQKAWDLVSYSLLGGIIGARILHVLNDWPYYSTRLIQIFEVWKGGLAFFGGIVGTVAVAYWYARKHKIDFLAVSDGIVLFLPFVIFLGRIANFLNSEHIGLPADLPWSVVFQAVDNIPRHPAQLYEGLTMLLLFGILLFLNRYRQKAGMLFFEFLSTYGIFRFITEFFRQTSSWTILGLTDAQWLSLLVSAIGIYFLIRSRK